MMIGNRKTLKFSMLLAGIFAATTLTNSAVARAQSATAPTGSSQAAPAPISPQSPKVAAGEANAKQLVLLMDTDKNGKISHKEYMDFMAAEFDRLDTDKSGELDVKELEKSQIATTRNGGTRR